MTKKINNKLDKKTIDQIKQDLLKRKKQILEDLNDIASKTEHEVKFPEFGDKTDENAQEITEYSTNLSTDKILESTLRDIDNALKRIKNNTYGICQYCKEPIQKKRIIARSVATACIKCKTKLQSR